MARTRKNIYFTDKQVERLAKMSREENLPEAEIVRRALDAYLAWNDPTYQPTPQKERLFIPRMNHRGFQVRPSVTDQHREFSLYTFSGNSLKGALANSWGNRRCRFIVHSADLSAMVLIHEFPERSTKIKNSHDSPLTFDQSGCYITTVSSLSPQGGG